MSLNGGHSAIFCTKKPKIQHDILDFCPRIVYNFGYKSFLKIYVLFNGGINMKKFLALTMTLLLVLTFCVGCGGGDSGSGGGDTIKIGVFEPASGDNGAGGKQETLGIQYANKMQPTVEIGGTEYNVELVIVDNESDNAKAVTAAQTSLSNAQTAFDGGMTDAAAIDIRVYLAEDWADNWTMDPDTDHFWTNAWISFSRRRNTFATRYPSAIAWFRRTVTGMTSLPFSSLYFPQLMIGAKYR